MRHTGTCPKCQNTDLLHVARVSANADTDPNTGEHQTMHLAMMGVHGRQGGRLQAYACPRCGLVELYLAEPLVPDGVYVRRVTAPSQGPHRT